MTSLKSLLHDSEAGKSQASSIMCAFFTLIHMYMHIILKFTLTLVFSMIKILTLQIFQDL